MTSCSRGNYIQYLAIIYNGKESEKEYMYILKHFSVHLKLTQHYKSTTILKEGERN